ncbi:MAG TPA: AMP-binding protein [Micromonosporaceae bacterium]|nr:AMP-binding protein [Micromonosporaceae bacterium]
MAYPRTAEEVESARSARLPAALDQAWRSSFFRRRLEKAGIARGEVPTGDAWQRIEPTTKDELRQLSSEEFHDELVVAEPGDIAMVWRSGGVTGRPLFYPKHRDDLPALIESFTRILELAGIGRGSLVHNSFPFLGAHPIGHMFGHALRDRGCGNVFAGSGANTPSETQVRLLFELRPTAWLGIGSYLNILGHRAEAMGYDPAASSLRTIVSSAEPLTPARRARMRSVWGGAELYDCYGMTECSMMGGECARHDGLHVWTDLFQLEILDPETLQPLPYGEVGAVVVTPLHSARAIPFLRWWSGDLGALEPGCDCAFAAFPRLRLAARTVGFAKVRGVNISYVELEETLLGLDVVADYLVRVTATDLDDRLNIEVEPAAGHDPATVVATVVERVSTAYEVRPDVAVVARGSIAERLERDVKQVRVRDERG